MLRRPTDAGRRHINVRAPADPPHEIAKATTIKTRLSHIPAGTLIGSDRMHSGHHITASVASIRAIARDLKNLGMEIVYIQLDQACDSIIDSAIYDLGLLERRLEDCRQQMRRRPLVWRPISEYASGKDLDVQ